MSGGDYTSEQRAQARYHAQLAVEENEVRRLARRLVYLDPIWNTAAYQRTRTQLADHQAALALLRETAIDHVIARDDAL